MSHHQPRKFITMKCNVGSKDALLRLALAVVLLSLSTTLTGGVALAAQAVAAVLGFTVAVGFCPAYVPFKLNTACCGSCGCGGKK